jgi:hypothetical protein
VVFLDAGGDEVRDEYVQGRVASMAVAVAGLTKVLGIPI